MAENVERLGYRFLLKADYLGVSSTYGPRDSDPIWIKGEDGLVASMTYGEFKVASADLEAGRPLPDGKVH